MRSHAATITEPACEVEVVRDRARVRGTAPLHVAPDRIDIAHLQVELRRQGVGVT